MDPAADLANAGIGAMISTECDVFVPDVVRALSPSNGFVEALEKLDAMMPFADALGLDTKTGLPSKGERDAMKGFVQNLGGKIVAVGEYEDTAWKVVGELQSQHLREGVEGVACVVGKVSTRWSEKQWKPLLALPGSSLLPRAQRRQLERKQPDPGEENQYLEGPAVMLHVLAIYR